MGKVPKKGQLSRRSLRALPCRRSRCPRLVTATRQGDYRALCPLSPRLVRMVRLDLANSVPARGEPWGKPREEAPEMHRSSSSGLRSAQCWSCLNVLGSPVVASSKIKRANGALARAPPSPAGKRSDSWPGLADTANGRAFGRPPVLDHRLPEIQHWQPKGCYRSSLWSVSALVGFDCLMPSIEESEITVR
jgi:hypothetical protein